ncbi:MAG: HD domain-containing protein [Deltaproteobacteria bacterium]|jgi:phosphoribosyl 1,2-cyclic phosphodiesterase|nr:HD domain-containing protein [Deltaproteobacteria bacterium]
MDIVLWGVRGGIAAPAQDTALYGGNTACVEVRTANGVLLFLDAGTGLREAGTRLPDSGEAHVCLTHGHADHIIGLWFFKPVHSPAWTTHLYLPDWLDPLPDWFYQCGLFPVPFEALLGKVIRHRVRVGETLRIAPGDAASPPVLVDAFAVRHPGGCLGYRVRADDAVFVYTGDHEMGDSDAGAAMEGMLRGADLAVVDAQYNREDYRPGFGHSAWEDWLDVARRAELRHLVFSHHDPARSDAQLRKLDDILRSARQDGQFRALVAREGLRFTLGKASAAYAQRDADNAELMAPLLLARRKSDHLFHFLETLARYRDTSSILDCILAKAREITLADAGTIFLTDGADLVFAYSHNDSLFSADEAHRHAYAAIRLPVSEKSIAGYVAATGKPLSLADVRALPPGAPYSFHDGFDRKTGFVTKSMLILPLLAHNGKILGVLELINSLDPLDRTPRPFGADMAQDCRVLAREVSGILECSTVEKRGIYGILRMAEVHDPAETGPHAERVGAITAELYHVWALGRGYGPDIIRHDKGCLRLASMLHDIGKVGVSDAVLKKPGKLTDEEFSVMRGHTALGASILSEDGGEIAALARCIALHHHQKWDGTGYAGTGEKGKLAGEGIPLGARITAIADVFDALVSPRCYKEPWPFEKALALLREEAGSHFDPALVAGMDGIEDLLHAIYAAFPDTK